MSEATRVALIVDGNMLCQTVWHTDAGRSLTTRDGRPSGVAHSFITSLCAIWAKLKPDLLYIVWDRRSRHRTKLADDLRAQYPDLPAYKEKRRVPSPCEPCGGSGQVTGIDLNSPSTCVACGGTGQGRDEYRLILKPQMEALQGLMPYTGFRQFVIDGVEGDDLIGITADALASLTYQVFIASTDKDLYQLISGRTALFNSKTKKVVDYSVFRETYGIEPSQWPELRALTGDDGDSIPGIKGIGEKTALKMIKLRSLPQWLACDPALEDQTNKKNALKVQKLADQVRTAYDLSYILSGIDQLDEDQATVYREQWGTPARADLDAVRGFVDSYELISAGAKLMDLMTGSAMAAVTTLDELWQQWGECTRCPLSKTRHQIVYSSGPPNAPLCFIGEGPGGGEDFRGEGFVGLAGQHLDKLLAFAGIDRPTIRIMNAVMCLPRDGKEIREPTAGEIAACRPRVQAEIRLVQPKLVILLGGAALKAFFPAVGKISTERGAVREHPDFPGTLFFPAFHPSYLMRLPQGTVGPAGLHGAHSDVVRSNQDWLWIANFIKEHP